MTPTFIEEYRVSDVVSRGLMRIAQKAKDNGILQPGFVGSPPKVIPEAKLSLECNLGDIPPDLFNDKDQNILEKYRWHIFDCIKKYAEIYVDCANFSPTGPPKIQWYGPGEGYFAEHFDNGYQFNNREIVYITYLNTPIDGGGTKFVNQKLTINPEEGKTVLFPAGFTHKHCGVTSDTSDKVIFTGWFQYSNRM